MGTLYTCNYQFNILPGWNRNLGNPPRGGRLAALGSGPLWSPAPSGGATQPTLMGNSGGVAGDQIQAVVTFNAGAPSNPVAVFTFTPAQDAATNQIGASPFLSGGTFVCSQSFTGVQQKNSTTTYVFGPTAPYNGGLQGAYELTIVITDSTGTQWSIDPEFDTGN